MTVKFNESVYKASEQAQEEEMRKKIEENLTMKLITQFKSQWAQLAVEKAARKREMKNEKSKLDKIWTFIKT